MPAVRKRGRPPSGPAGAKRSEMRQMTARLADEDHRRLASLARTLGLSRAEVISKALATLERTLRRS